MNAAFLRGDVRFVRASGKSGLERNGRVLWFDEPVAAHLWANGPGSFGPQLQERLDDWGFVGSRVAHGDRSLAFLEVLTGANEWPTGLQDWEVQVLGCGGLGSNVAMQMASLGVGRLVIVDPDVVDASNLNRLFWADASSVGRPKVECLKDFLGQRFATQVIAKPEPAQTAVAGATGHARCLRVLAMDDNLASRSTASLLAESDVFPYLHCGYIGARCVAGPLVTCPGDACPFCDSGRLVFERAWFAAPSAMPNNLFLASFVASQLCLLALSDGRMLVDRRWIGDLRTGVHAFETVTKNERCEVCS